MSDAVWMAAISAGTTITTSVIGVVGVILHRKLNDVKISVDGRLQQLLDSQTKGARAEGKLEGNIEGRAEAHEENKKVEI